MSLRSVKQRHAAVAVAEGAGVSVRRSIGIPALPCLDPFLLLDHFSSDDPDDYIAGFPDHPHRGFSTFTYMLDGRMLHRDSMGNRGELGPGGAQWMKAASGVIHSEMPRQREGLMRGFQLWINLPAAEKMSDPAYQEYPAEAFPVIEGPGRRVKLLIGEHAGRRSPVQDPHTQVSYLDLSLAPGAASALPVDPGHNAFVYLFEGGVELGGVSLRPHELAVLGEGDEVALQASAAGARLLLVAGRALGEPVVQYGPFVMNTREQILQAFEDYNAGRLVRRRADTTGGPPPS